MSKPDVRGWCPGAYRPMMSGDGLVVRIRPRLARLDRTQILGLCALALEHGNGFLDLTNRANLQIRGIAGDAFERLLGGLAELDLLDEDPKMESRPNILVAPFWMEGDLTWRLAGNVPRILPHAPDLPAKFGLALDCGAAPCLQDAPADIRIERGTGGLVLRLDGMPLGRSVREEDVPGAILEAMEWFAAHRTPEARRMVRVVARTRPPAHWATEPALTPGNRPEAGPHELGAVLGAAFGQIDAAALHRLIEDTAARALRVTPWRLFVLEGAAAPEDEAFITRSDDALLATDACPGAPFCPQATVETRVLARTLASSLGGGLHVSGCAKGCARPRAAATTLVGRDGRFDLVKDGAPWDAPVRSGLEPEDLVDGILTGAD